MTLLEVSNKIKNNPLVLHINPIGLLRLDHTNQERFNKFNLILNTIQHNGGNIAIPTYSYSFTSNKVYDVRNTPSELDEVSEYIRIKNPLKRTMDANFSYLLFGNNFSDKFYKSIDYSSFGENSLIEDIFLQDGYLGAIGGVIEYLTEVHYLERKLNVDYRFDKKFSGSAIDKNNKKQKYTLTYYCRDLKSDYAVSFVQLKNDLKEEGLIETWFIDKYKLKLEVIKFKVLYNFIEAKLLNNPKYLWET